MQIMNYVKGRFCRNWIFLFQTYAMFWMCAHPDTRPISFTYAPMASMWVVTLHDPFLYSDPPLPCHPPSYWLRLFSSQTFSHINTPTFSNLVILHTYPPMKMEQRVPKRRHIKFRRRGITQKKAYNWLFAQGQGCKNPRCQVAWN